MHHIISIGSRLVLLEALAEAADVQDGEAPHVVAAHVARSFAVALFASLALGWACGCVTALVLKRVTVPLGVEPYIEVGVGRSRPAGRLSRRCTLVVADDDGGEIRARRRAVTSARGGGPSCVAVSRRSAAREKVLTRARDRAVAASVFHPSLPLPDAQLDPARSPSSSRLSTRRSSSPSCSGSRAS